MKTYMTRILTVALLMMFSMGARAQISIVLGGEKNDGVYAGGTIAAKQNDAKDGKVTVTLIATPESGYTINKDDIFVYETISPSMTRADEQPTVGNRLKLDGPEGDISKATEYTVTVDANLGIWVKEAKFTKSRDRKGGNSVYVYLKDGHYLAHGGNDVIINSTIPVTAPTEFNPNTCMWEAISDGSNFKLLAFGTENYYMNVSAVTNYYQAVVSTTSRGFGNVNTNNNFRTWPKSLIGTEGTGYPSHYIQYHPTYGWIATESDEDKTPYNAANKPTPYLVTITEAEGSYQGPVATISGDSELTDYGSFEYAVSSLSIETTTYANYEFNSANHYWYEFSDHGATAPSDWEGELTSTWSIADNGGFATIDANGTVSVHKLPATDLSLTIQLTVTDGTHSCVFTKTVILKGTRRFVIKDNTNRYMQLSGTTLGSSTSFSPDNMIWTSVDNSNGTAYGITQNSTSYYIRESQWVDGKPTTANVEAKDPAYDHRWYGVSPDFMKSARGNCVYWYNNIWTLTTDTEEDGRVKVFPVTTDQKSYTNITASMGGVEEIDYSDDYSYTIEDFGSSVPYHIYTFDEGTHYWYDSSDHDTAPNYDDWGDISDENLTKTWSLSGDNVNTYAEVDEDGKLTIKKLPTSGTVTITLKCTITKNYNGQDLSHEVTKTITLMPEVIQAPIISLTKDGDVTKLNISSVQTHELVFYYEMGNSEPATDDPTTESVVYDPDEPPTVGDDIVCIKAYAVHHSGHSAVTTYNILRFSTETVGSGDNEATVAPMVYSSDLATPDGMTPYIVSRVTPLTNSVVLTELSYIPKNVPVLLLDKGKHEGAMTNITLSPKAEATPTVSTSVTAANLLKVSDGKMKVSDAQVYMYHKGEFVLTFNGTLKDGRYYLNNPNYRPSSSQPSGTRLYIDFEKTTDIKGIEESSTSGKSVGPDIYYSLDGRRLSGTPTQKGVYVCNGRKIVIK